ncbi:hypothetical protein N7509_003898 [Penicillium cosmopolitanum]|uniref:Uncharacterized protein n=1 Tax=Penicillium cosmopolitanum TaxID=1131564 RepID=A0A9W9W5Z4_9EURO|nr:uncharacterized protein N7509_003898 [Penicillium cosmopolitanum]KAJ5404027.1 hypothetical protein N7509_003898 [Penicillium cosmopolitanum]
MGINLATPVAKIIAQIAPAAAIFPPATADLLVLGKRGAPGFPWAAMSIFSAASVIKTCVAAAFPDWMREIFKIRSDSTDSEIGLILSLVPDYNNKAKLDLGENGCIGVLVKNGTQQAIYKLDEFTNHIVQDAPEFKENETEIISRHRIDPIYFQKHNWLNEVLSLLTSAIKIAEFIVLLCYDAAGLGLLSALSWLVFFIYSLFIIIMSNLSTSFRNQHNRTIDVVVGNLPRFGQPGSGGRRICLGVPQNQRRSLLWKPAWIFGAAVYTYSLVHGYALLNTQNENVIIIWTGFQLLWLFLRFLFFWLAEDADKPTTIPPSSKVYSDLQDFEIRKIQMLMLSLSRCQMNIHRRGKFSYESDIKTHMKIEEDLRSGSISNVLDSMPECYSQIPQELIDNDWEIPTTMDDIRIIHVIGDTLLRSACWLAGTTHNHDMLYDACMVCVESRGQSALVPAARVLFSTVPRDPNYDPDNERIYPRGTKNEGPSKVEWCYWIPASSSKWLEVTSTGLKVFGKSAGRNWVSEGDIEKKLQGPLHISFNSMKDIERIVEISMLAYNDLKRVAGVRDK